MDREELLSTIEENAEEAKVCDPSLPTKKNYVFMDYTHGLRLIHEGRRHHSYRDHIEEVSLGELYTRAGYGRDALDTYYTDTLRSKYALPAHNPVGSVFRKYCQWAASNEAEKCLEAMGISTNYGRTSRYGDAQ